MAFPQFDLGLPKGTTPQWTTEPARGSYDIERMNRFKFPLSPSHADDRDLSDSRSNSSNMISPRQLQRSATHGLQRPRLRRSIRCIDLRRHMDRSGITVPLGITTGGTDIYPQRHDPSPDLRRQMDRSGITVPVGITTGGTDIYPRRHDPSPDHDSDKEAMAMTDAWLHTATTVDQYLTRSPLTPRPFNARELGNRISEYPNDNTLGTADRADSDDSSVLKDGNMDETSRAYHSDLYRHHQDQVNGILPYLSEGVPQEAGHGPGYAALLMMHRAQEQVRQGRDLPPLTFNGIALQNWESDRIRRGPGTFKFGIIGQEPAVVMLDPAPKKRKSKMGDPIKRPGPSTIQPLTTADNEKRVDIPIYTTEGLFSVLSKVYAPGLVPSDVLAALPSPHALFDLSSTSTSAGHLAHVRATLSPSLACNLSCKERSYVAFYMDTLLQREAGLGREVKRLEGEVKRLEGNNENAEFRKAVLQGEINIWFAEGQESKDEIEKLVKLVELLVQIMPEDMMDEVRSMSAEMGISFERFETARSLVGGAGSRQQDEERNRMTRRMEEEVRYWRARAEAGERFLVSMG